MFKASLRFWNFLMDVVGNTPKTSALPTAPHLVNINAQGIFALGHLEQVMGIEPT